MPSSAYVQGAIGRQWLSTSFQTPHSFRPAQDLISATSWNAVGDGLNAFGNLFYGSMTYPAASRVLAYPFELDDPFLVRKVWWLNGTTAATDSADVGVYNEAGTTLLVHGGSTLIATANVVQEADPADVLLLPGRYWCAYVQSGTTATPQGILQPANFLRMMGVAEMAGSGSTLGATFTPAAVASAALPHFGIANRTQVA